MRSRRLVLLLLLLLVLPSVAMLAAGLPLRAQLLAVLLAAGWLGVRALVMAASSPVAARSRASSMPACAIGPLPDVPALPAYLAPPAPRWSSRQRTQLEHASSPPPPPERLLPGTRVVLASLADLEDAPTVPSAQPPLRLLLCLCPLLVPACGTDPAVAGVGTRLDAQTLGMLAVLGLYVLLAAVLLRSSRRSAEQDVLRGVRADLLLLLRTAPADLATELRVLAQAITQVLGDKPLEPGEEGAQAPSTGGRHD